MENQGIPLQQLNSYSISSIRDPSVHQVFSYPPIYQLNYEPLYITQAKSEVNRWAN